MACHSYWNNIVIESLFRMTLQSIALDCFELPLHYYHMKMMGISYLLYQNLPKGIVKTGDGFIHI